ncbi:endonuclease [Streptomyces sp. SP18BB07]|uniref:endonuclease n=1 Tax=Streptomyces sp. SP18BB07 TaxID=3002522 RepID=UPI002E77FF3D|nr:endonuclease [Streptomyces sp. SP18BB07]MEE1762576.1 endonuclease [Streptomyces sp. SP18BB07]
MTTAELFSPTESGYLSQLTRAADRFADRAERRERHQELLRTRGVLYADEPERVEKRLNRLGTDWSQARAIDREPTEPRTTSGSTLRLPPEHFGSDMLGLERLIGRNNLTPVAFLEKGALVARSVGRITLSGPGGGHGTGFMVSPSLLLTNNHVVRSQEEARRSTVAFALQAGVDGRPLVPAVFQLEPQRFFVTDRELDFTLVAVAERGGRGEALSSFGLLPLSEEQGKIVIGEFVNIIQHPAGEPKQVALRENQVVDILDRFLHSTTDTLRGSSGAPVLNDQWEVVALHHSAVPKTDAEGRPLSVDGTLWTPEMGEERVAWVANEGVRISRILRTLSTISLTGTAARLRDEVLTAGPTGESVAVPVGVPRPVAPSPPPVDGAGGLPGADGTRVQVTDGIAHLTVPLRISVGLDLPARPVTSMSTPAPFLAPAPPSPPAAPADGASAVERDMEAALISLRLGRERPYYDRQADAVARDTYYAGIDTGDAEALRRALTELLEDTHSPRPRYRPNRLVYPWVDLHRDGRLRSIYSGKDFAPEEFIRADAAVAEARLARVQELFARERAAGPAEFEAEFDALEALMPFNCEHVVPQSWFAHKEPMRGDLHHLFACEVGCNSFRNNFAYFDFPNFQEVEREECGMRDPVGSDRSVIGFEPESGKGAVARATLYFLLRYPGLVGDVRTEFPESRLPTLLAWHAGEPVSEYERHRNAAIAELQGDRNPLIDHPEWAQKIDFSGVWP